MALKGQGAAEYLVLLAMVLVVSLIGIILLGGFGSAGGDTMDAQSKTYWSGVASPFAVVGWMQMGDTIYLKIVNREPIRLILTNITIGNASPDLGAGWTVAPNGEKNISISGLETCNETNYDYFSYNLTFHYSTEHLTGKIQKGERPIAGRCSFQ
ncbi:MAG: hypothetical protein ABIH83_04485 [Candidatus Micrarchaeota archaeon]